jgi:acetyltransferase-like isoleucine patch superfamily enzyme
VTFLSNGKLIKLERSCLIEEAVEISNDNDHDLTIGEYCRIRAGAQIRNSVGNNCDLGPFSIVNAKIGNNVKIGARVVVNEEIPDNTAVYSQDLKVSRSKVLLDRGLHDKHLEYLHQVLPKYH